ncbi:unnamed protein product [Cuscuta campestris]|uniref:CCHC-type domain-containing protein n=1 Tax=Cuscuta campestris TaxID=132261 RepID=A0A484LAN6_9ASTE|nr:unnamed protein product [Cuscuta campestris]
MWDKLEVTYEGTDQVREAKIDFLTQEYEMFRMKEGEKIDDMFDRFSKIINDLHALKKTYANKDLVRKILRSLTPEWRSKADAIYESIRVSNVTIDGLRGNLKTYESTILTPSLDEQKKKGIALKATKEPVEDVSSDDDNDFGLVIKEFHKFMKKEFERKGRKHDGHPKCYSCGEIGHIKPRCPKAKHGKDKPGFKKQRAYISWGGDSGDESTDQEEDEAANVCFMAHEDQSDDVQEEPPWDTPSRNFGNSPYQDSDGEDYYEPHGDHDNYDRNGPIYDDQPDPLVEEIIRLEQRIFYFDEVLFAEGSWYEPPYYRDYTLSAEEQIEANKVAIRERAKLLESVQKEKEFERRLCEGSDMMQKMLDDFQRERLEAEAKADKLVNDQMREANVQKETLEPMTNPKPFNLQVPVLEDSLSSTPSQKPESITTLAKATVVMLPEYLPSQVPTSEVVYEVEPTEGPNSEPPMLIQEKKEEEVLPMAINDHLLNCVQDTPLEEPILEEVEPITCPQDSIESEQESIDEEILCIDEPISSI